MKKQILTCLKIINANIQTLTCIYDLNKENENTNNYKKNVQIVKLFLMMTGILSLEKKIKLMF